MPHKNDPVAYSVSGNYEDPTKAEFHICLPPEGENEYTFTEEVYNLSQVYNGNEINAILLLFKDKDNCELPAVNNHISRTYNISNPSGIDNTTAESFKPEADEILVVLFHDNVHSQSDMAEIFRKAPEYYTNAQVSSYNEDLYPAPLQPRRVGMSVVKKRGS